MIDLSLGRRERFQGVLWIGTSWLCLIRYSEALRGLRLRRLVAVQLTPKGADSAGVLRSLSSDA